MNQQQALEKAESIYGQPVYVVRKPKDGFASTNPVPSFLGEINTHEGQNQVWWVYRAQPPGRPTESPSGKVRKTVTLRLDPDLRDRAKAHRIKLGPLLEKAIIAALE
jgi:hypothetical protein